MVDNISKTARSFLMSKIKSKETKLEKSVRKVLSEKGIKYRKNSSKHFGKPDIVIASKEIAIFVDSCFWHGCNSYYRKNHWVLIRIWEHDVKNFSYSLIKGTR